MQITTNAITCNAPYWQEIKKLNKDEKLRLMALISTSLVGEPQKADTPASVTSQMIDRFCGAWVGDESAEEIIENIENSRCSHAEPATF